MVPVTGAYIQLSTYVLVVKLLNQKSAFSGAITNGILTGSSVHKKFFILEFAGGDNCTIHITMYLYYVLLLLRIYITPSGAHVE